MAAKHDDGMISKKDLLQETGISYGQLYRWKRENLLPERWFVKRSSFTGQETFLPRDKVLERVNTILRLKDQYSLEELARMFSPETDPVIYTREELLRIPDINERLVTQYVRISGRDHFQYIETVLLYVLTRVRRETFIDVDSTEAILSSIFEWTATVTKLSYRLFLLRYETGLLAVMLFQPEVGEMLLLDKRFEIVADIMLEEASRDFQKHQHELAAKL